MAENEEIDTAATAAERVNEDLQADALAENMTKVTFFFRINKDKGIEAAPDEIKAALQDGMLALSKLGEGKLDPWTRTRIATIIRKSTGYIVFLDEDLDVQWWWLTRPDLKVVGVVQARVAQLTKESSFLLQRRRRKGAWFRKDRAAPAGVTTSYEWNADVELAKHIRSVMAEALALALNGSTLEECETVLEEARRYIAIAKDQHTRPVFLVFFLIGVAALGAAMWLWICYGARCCAQLDHEFVKEALMASFAGGFGAMISAMSRTGSLGLEPAAGLRGLFIEAAARTLIGAGSGILVTLAFDSGLLVKGVADPNVQRYVWLFLCIASGISERILPALVGQAESLVSQTKSTKTGEPPGSGSDTQGSSAKTQ